MNGTHIEIMQNFSEKSIPNLDVCVLAALELLSQAKVPKMSIPYKHPLIVGSGNAIATGRIIFEDRFALFADESTFEEKLKTIKEIDGVVLLSASGGKHSPIIAHVSKKYKKHVTLITNTLHSPTEKELDLKHSYDQYVFPKNREPYTYNTSTYMGMIFGHTKEDPQKILGFIKKNVDRVRLPNFSRIKKYYIIVPEEFEGIVRLLNVKFIELFGRNIARDIETFEYIPHATTVVPSGELFISFGHGVGKKMQPLITKNSIHIPLPRGADYGAMMAIGYYIIGKIQKSQPPWFKKNIVNYMKKASKVFGKEMKVVVG